MNRPPRILHVAIAVAVLATLGTAWANWTVDQAADARVYLDARTVPLRRVGLVLGTAPRGHLGPNPFFERRLDAAAALYRAGRVRCLLVSGDHGTPYYDEVDAMRRGLVRRGVPAGRIAMDHAGFRTLDSLVRARRVFGVQDAVVVTDGFHLPRALYLARCNGIDAVGLSSAGVPTGLARWQTVDPLWPAEPPYAYAGDSPTSRVDPTGACSFHSGASLIACLKGDVNGYNCKPGHGCPMPPHNIDIALALCVFWHESGFCDSDLGKGNTGSGGGVGQLTSVAINDLKYFYCNKGISDPTQAQGPGWCAGARASFTYMKCRGLHYPGGYGDSSYGPPYNAEARAQSCAVCIKGGGKPESCGLKYFGKRP